MRINLETERLILRNLTPEDYRAVFRWCGDPDVARYMVYPVYTKEEDVKKMSSLASPAISNVIVEPAYFATSSIVLV